MKISQELYQSGILGHLNQRRAGRWEFFDPGLPSYRQPALQRNHRRRSVADASPGSGWRILVDVFRRHS